MPTWDELQSQVYIALARLDATLADLAKPLPGLSVSAITETDTDDAARAAVEGTSQGEAA